MSNGSQFPAGLYLALALIAILTPVAQGTTTPSRPMGDPPPESPALSDGASSPAAFPSIRSDSFSGSPTTDEPISGAAVEFRNFHTIDARDRAETASANGDRTGNASDSDGDGISDPEEGLTTTTGLPVIVADRTGGLLRIARPLRDPAVTRLPTTTVAGDPIAFGAVDYAPDGTLYGAQLDGNGIYRIDPDSGTSVRIGSVGPLESLRSLSFDENGIAYVGGSNSRTIYRFETSTGTARGWYRFPAGSPVGPLVFADETAFIFWRGPNGTISLYYVGITPDNRVSGDLHRVGELNTTARDLAGDLLSSLDSDGDGVPDLLEANSEPATDTDGDGTIDALDTDSDDDGIGDRIEGTDDSDDDGTPNYRDTDRDDNGTSDANENADDTATGTRRSDAGVNDEESPDADAITTGVGVDEPPNHHDSTDDRSPEGTDDRGVTDVRSTTRQDDSSGNDPSDGADPAPETGTDDERESANGPADGIDSTTGIDTTDGSVADDERNRTTRTTDTVATDSVIGTDRDDRSAGTAGSFLQTVLSGGLIAVVLLLALLGAAVLVSQRA